MLVEHIYGHLNQLGNDAQTRARALIRARMLTYGQSYISLLIHWEF